MMLDNSAARTRLLEIGTSDTLPRGGRGGSSAAACLRAASVSVGVGGFVLPWAFEQLGLVFGPLAVFTVALLSRRALADLLRSRVALARGAVPVLAPKLAAMPPRTRADGLVELAAGILGPSAGSVTRVLLVLRSAGIAAVHAGVALAALQPLETELQPLASEVRAPLSVHLPWSEPLNRVLYIVFLVVVPLLCLSAKRLAVLGLSGMLALFAAVVATLAIGATWLPLAGFEGGSGMLTLQPRHPVPLFPSSLGSFVRALGVLPLLFWGHLAVLPPVLDAMARPRDFRCIAHASFVVSSALSVCLGFFGAPLLLDATVAPDAGGGASTRTSVALSVCLGFFGAPLLLDATVLPDVGGGVAQTRSTAMLVGRAFLFTGCIALCPAMLVPALEHLRRLLPKVPHLVSSLGLLGFVACLVRWGGPPEQLASLVGGSVQCLLGIVLPSLLALGAMPWQSRAQTLFRVSVATLGFGAAALSVALGIRGLIAGAHERG
mmetsp:Transcript_31859/g.105655  ORF Transcript_31859/g.105655 Transcript_31859/m.105655 type:complete len:492 (+) Transcript_31859:45-1520(+)